MIISQTSEGIYLAWREDKVRKTKSIPYSEFPPYFFIKATASKVDNIIIKNKWGQIKSIEISYQEGDYFNLDNEKLTKVICHHPADIFNIKDEFDITYEADVPYSHRYVIDKIKSIPQYNMRKWYWDMEWQQGGEYDGSITCIVVYDSYDKEYNRYYWLPSNVSNPELEDDANNYIFTNEKDMLLSFIVNCMMDDPDMLIAWFGNLFDLPKLLERCIVNKIDGRMLSPIQEITSFTSNGGIYKFDKEHFSPIEQPIKGRIILSLDVAFERQWTDAQRGTLPSLALDYVSDMVLGEKKLVSEKFPDKNEFFQRAWLEDTKTYLEYALIDVELIHKLDKENYLSEAILSLQQLLIAPFDACFYATHMANIYFMRNAWWKCPSKSKNDKVKYQGAMVYDPNIEKTNGLHYNVAAFDFASLYPSMMVARNISWETKSLKPTEFGVNILTPRDFSDCTKEEMLYYKTDKLGVLPKSVLKLKQLRDEYKQKMYSSETDNDYAIWNNNQMAVKRLMASFYGIVGYQGFGWADVDLAASITASAREAIREAAFIAQKIVVVGD
jgi:DNA polymerase elongation subunit (family B)